MGHTARPVSPAQVTKIRAETADRSKRGTKPNSSSKMKLPSFPAALLTLALLGIGAAAAAEALPRSA